MQYDFSSVIAKGATQGVAARGGRANASGAGMGGAKARVPFELTPELSTTESIIEVVGFPVNLVLRQICGSRAAFRVKFLVPRDAARLLTRMQLPACGDLYYLWCDENPQAGHEIVYTLLNSATPERTAAELAEQIVRVLHISDQVCMPQSTFSSLFAVPGLA